MKFAAFLALATTAQVFAFGGDSSDASCPFLKSHGTKEMSCRDGTSCAVPKDPAADGDWGCCNDHGGRLACPDGLRMCASPTGCAGGNDYCCNTDCTSGSDGDQGGFRSCERGYCAGANENGELDTTMVCNDGSSCEVPSDPAADGDWGCCNDHGGRKSCPDGMSMCANPTGCAGGTDHCCNDDCIAGSDGDQGGLFHCDTDNGSCDWMTSTTHVGRLECADGTFCTVCADPTDTSDGCNWGCCNEHGGRARCPAGTKMCANDNGCAGGQDHCCNFDCSTGSDGDQGGFRGC